jgi:hypothetical protein
MPQDPRCFCWSRCVFCASLFLKKRQKARAYMFLYCAESYFSCFTTGDICCRNARLSGSWVQPLKQHGHVIIWPSVLESTYRLPVVSSHCVEYNAVSMFPSRGSGGTNLRHWAHNYIPFQSDVGRTKPRENCLENSYVFAVFLPSNDWWTHGGIHRQRLPRICLVVCVRCPV